MCKVKRNIFLPALMLVLFLSYQAGITLFVHTHVLLNGAVVAHSHPYAEKSHKHAEAQIVAFNMVSSLQSLEPDKFNVEQIYWQFLNEIGEEYKAPFILATLNSNVKIRAPSYFC